MKTLVAVIATALITAGAAWAASSTFGLNPGQSIRIEGTNLQCAAYYAQEGNALECHEIGQPSWVGMGPANIVVTRREKPSTLTTAPQLTRMIKTGDLDLATTWSSDRQESSRSISDATTIANLKAKVVKLTATLATTNGQLETAKQQLAAAQSSAVSSLESGGVSRFMVAVMPQLGAWFQGQGFDFSQTVDQSIGFASYEFQCDSCAAGH